MPIAGCNQSDKPSESKDASKPTDSTTEKCPHKPKIKSGGISGQVLDVTYEADGCECDSLQCIQIVWATGGPITVGKMKVIRGGETYDAFVDGGKNSPFVTMSGYPPAHSTKPFYLTASEVSNQVSYNKTTKKGTIRIYDAPSAVNSWDKVFFETAIVCVNNEKSGKDKILKAFKWGWIDKGKTYKTSPSVGAKTSGIEEYDGVSSEFKDVVNNDYPGYSYY